MKINIDIGGRHQGFGISAHQRPLYKNNSRPALPVTGWNVKFKLNRKIYRKKREGISAALARSLYCNLWVPAVGGE